MKFITKLLIPIFIIVAIVVIAISYHDITTTILSKPSDKVIYMDEVVSKQTPYVIQPSPTKIYPITPQPTPTPLYYESLQNPSEPCTETYKKFQSNCMGRTKNESYCDYWLAESRKKCSFMQW